MKRPVTLGELSRKVDGNAEGIEGLRDEITRSRLEVTERLTRLETMIEARAAWWKTAGTLAAIASGLAAMCAWLVKGILMIVGKTP